MKLWQRQHRSALLTNKATGISVYLGISASRCFNDLAFHQSLCATESLGSMEGDLFHMYLPGSLAKAVVDGKEMPLYGKRI